MWLDSLKAAGYSTNTLNTRRCQMSALSRALEGDPRDVEGDDLLAHFAAKSSTPDPIYDEKPPNHAACVCGGFGGFLVIRSWMPWP